MTDDVDRIAGAPISWGVCEVSGWGYQLPADQVLSQMSEIGLSATELGPDGFLPVDPDELASTLAAHDLHAVGGFTPFIMHRSDVAAVVQHLRGNGYDGWYTLEQDTILTEPPDGEGPVVDVRTSVEYLRSLLLA